MNLFQKNLRNICVKHVGHNLYQLPRNSKQVFVLVLARRNADKRAGEIEESGLALCASKGY